MIRRGKLFPSQWHAKQAEESTRLALAFLIAARGELKNANAPKTLARVNAAISSVKGAIRNASCRVVRAYYEERRANGEA